MGVFINSNLSGFINQLITATTPPPKLPENNSAPLPDDASVVSGGAVNDEIIDPTLNSQIANYLSATTSEEKMEAAFTLAFLNHLKNNYAEYEKWRIKAINNACKIPDVNKLILPILEGDFLALEKNYGMALKSYKAVIPLIKEYEDNPDKYPINTDAAKERIKSVVTTVMIQYVTDPSLKKDETKKADAIQAAEILYLLEPSENNLTSILAIYSATDEDLSKIFADLKQMQDTGPCEIYESLLEEVKMMDSAFNTDQYLNSSQPAAPGKSEIDMGIFEFGSISDDFSNCMAAHNTLASSPWMGANGIAMHMSWHQMKIDYLKAKIENADSHLIGIIDQAFKGDKENPVYQSHLSYLMMLTGRKEEAEKLLYSAHLKYQGLSDDKKTDELRLNEVNVLFRLFTIYEGDIHEQQGILNDAYTEIKNLFKEEYETGIPVYLQYYQLKAEFLDQKAEKDFKFERIDKHEYRIASEAGHKELINYCKKIVNNGITNNQELISILTATATESNITIWEKELSYALDMHIKEEEDSAKAISAQVISAKQAYFSDLDFISHLSPEQLNEYQARFNLAVSYYDIHSGQIKKAIDDLQMIALDYSNTNAAKAIFKYDFWPHKYGIVDDNGNWSKGLNQPSTWEGIKKSVSKVMTQQGRGLAACGIGAGLFIIADIALGEKVSGGELLLACTASYLADRTFVVNENWNEISDAYNTGVSLIDDKEALQDIGLFIFDLATIYVGGAAGRVAEQAVLRSSIAAKKGMINWFVKRGALQGPWTKPVTAGWLIREGSIVANAWAFHNTSRALQSIPRGSQNFGNVAGASNDNMFVSWLFVRLMPIFNNLNLSAKVVKDISKLDKAVQFAGDMALGAAAIQGILEGVADNEGNYLDRTAETIFQLMILHGGQKTIDYVGFKKILPALGVDLTDYNELNPYKKKNLNLKENVKKLGQKITNPEVDAKLWKGAVQEGAALWDFSKIAALSTYFGLRNIIKWPLKFFKSGDAKPAVKEVKADAEVVKNEIEKVKGLYNSLWNPPKEYGFFRRQWHLLKTSYNIYKNVNWKLIKENPEGIEDLMVETAYLSIPPWQRGEYSLEALKEAALRFKNGDAGEGRKPGQIDTEIFKPKKAGANNDNKQYFFNTLTEILFYPLTALGKWFANATEEASEKTPRFFGTRNLILALKELQREVTRSTLPPDPPQWFNTFMDSFRGPKGIEKKAAKKAEKDTALKKAIMEGSMKGLSKLGHKWSYFYKTKVFPFMRFVHALSIGYSAADFLFLDFNDSKKEDELFDYEIDSLPGAVAFIMGSNLIVEKMGITTLGGAGFSELIKTATWGTLVSMEGSNPWKYFNQKPQEIVVLHIEYFAVLMGQVILYQGMNSKPGNPIYKGITNLPVVRTLKSASRFYKYYTKRSMMQTPDLSTSAGRWISFLYAGPFHLLNAEVTKGDKLLDSHGYLQWHRLAKVAHLGLWLKPLGVALDQSSTKGQIAERILGFGVDYLHGLSTPIKLGKGTYEQSLVNALDSVDVSQLPKEAYIPLDELKPDEVTESIKAANEMTVDAHKIASSAMTSLDFVGWLGNMVAERAGYGSKNWQPKSGWRIEIEAVMKHLKIMEKLVSGSQAVALDDAFSMDNLLTNHKSLGINIGKKYYNMPLIVRALEQKMWANKWANDKTANSQLEPYWHSIYGPDINPDAKKFWKNIPTPASHDELLKYVQELNDGTLKANEIIAPLMK